jgi:16S rRNA (uracil1498-N3)-methyltransferase
VAEKPRLRFIVEKLSELGVDELLWLSTRRAEARPPSAAKTRAWAVAALEQSRGAWLMKVGDPVALSRLEASRLIVAEHGNPLLTAVGDSDIIVIGPPGGIEAEEIPGGARRIGLGERVLRVDTAAIAAAVLALDRSRRLHPSLNTGQRGTVPI